MPIGRRVGGPAIRGLRSVAFLPGRSTPKSPGGPFSACRQQDAAAPVRSRRKQAGGRSPERTRHVRCPSLSVPGQASGGCSPERTCHGRRPPLSVPGQASGGCSPERTVARASAYPAARHGSSAKLRGPYMRARGASGSACPRSGNAQRAARCERKRLSAQWEHPARPAACLFSVSVHTPLPTTHSPLPYMAAYLHVQETPGFARNTWS
jgi:hypothetical protein